MHPCNGNVCLQFRSNSDLSFLWGKNIVPIFINLIHFVELGPAYSMDKSKSFSTNFYASNIKLCRFESERKKTLNTSSSLMNVSDGWVNVTL